MFTAYHCTAPNTYLERHGVLPEQLQPGMRFVHRPGITMSQQDNVDEALDSHNAAMLHYDEVYARHTAWGRPLMVSTLTVQRLIGMTSKTFARTARLRRIASISMTAPVFGGDTLYAETEVLSVGTSDAPHGRCVVSLRTTGWNQDHHRVAVLDYQAELWREGYAPVDREGGVPAQEARFASHRQRADGAWLEQTGLYLEDLRVGERFVHSPRRTLLREEAVHHAARALDVAAECFDGTQAPRSDGVGVCVPQTWVLSVVAALSTRLLGRVTANLGWVDVEFGQEVRDGDTLQASTTVLALRDSASRPHEGIVTVRTVAANQHGQACLSFERTLLVYRRSGDSPYAAAGY